MRPERLPFVADARAEALRNGHAQITATHLLRAVVASPEAGTVLCAQLGVCKVRLEERLDELAAALPPTSYRGSVSPELDPQLVVLLEAVHARGFFRRFFAAPSLADSFAALLQAPQLAGAEVRFDPAPIEHFREAVSAYARRRGHRDVLIDHALIVLLETDERMRGAVRLLGLEPNAVRNKIAFRMTDRFRSLKLAGLPGLLLLASVYANGVRRRDLGTEGIVSSLFKYEPIKQALVAANADPYDLYFAWVHGDREALPLPDGARLDVVIEDDAFSPAEAVVLLLREVFGVLHDRAVQHATETTENGSSVVVAGIARAEAEVLLLAAREARRARRLPLRITARTA